MTVSHQCQVCLAESLELLEEYPSLPRVTSDAKPWPSGGKLCVCHGCGAIQKLPDEKWRDEAMRIYRNYEMYHLSRGSEQLVFADSGAALPRSQQLVDFVMQRLNPPRNGKLIDIGCGNGEALANFANVVPEWQLYGSELSDRVRPALRRLKSFINLYTVPPHEIDERFTLVTMIHSLEHMPEPLKTLRDAIQLIEPEGALFVEVPDIETSPFDLLVADHMMHFSRNSLGLLAERCGIVPFTLINDLIPKEITLLGRCGAGAKVKLDPSVGVRLARSTVQWLVEVMSQVHKLAKNGGVGIFGTSVAGMAIYGAFRERVGFFVDEDPARAGRSYDGKPVVAPKDVPKGVPVIMALPPERARRAAHRLENSGMLTVVPPALHTSKT